jgi:hypothetical protein
MDELFALGGTGVETYLNARARFFKLVGMLFCLIMFQWSMNYWGFQIVNAIIFFVIMGFGVYVYFHPAFAATLLALEKTRERKKRLPNEVPTTENTNFFGIYLAFFCLWAAVVSMILVSFPFGWYLPFGEALGYTLVGLIFLSVIGWTSFFKWTTTSVYKRVISAYAIIGFIGIVLVFVPASTKFWLTGWDCYGPLGTSAPAKAVAKAKYKIFMAESEARAEEISRVGNEIARCRGGKDCLESISQADLDLWNGAKNEVSNESLPSKISGAASDVSSSFKRSDASESHHIVSGAWKLPSEAQAALAYDFRNVK